MLPNVELMTSPDVWRPVVQERRVAPHLGDGGLSLLGELLEASRCRGVAVGVDVPPAAGG